MSSPSSPSASSPSSGNIPRRDSISGQPNMRQEQEDRTACVVSNLFFVVYSILNLISRILCGIAFLGFRCLTCGVIIWLVTSAMADYSKHVGTLGYWDRRQLEECRREFFPDEFKLDKVYSFVSALVDWAQCVWATRAAIKRVAVLRGLATEAVERLESCDTDATCKMLVDALFTISLATLGAGFFFKMWAFAFRVAR